MASQESLVLETTLRFKTKNERTECQTFSMTEGERPTMPLQAYNRQQVRRSLPFPQGRSRRCSHPNGVHYVPSLSLRTETTLSEFITSGTVRVSFSRSLKGRYPTMGRWNLSMEATVRIDFGENSGRK